MTNTELEWRLHKAAIDKTLNRPTREACVDAARKLHEIEKTIRRAEATPRESLMQIKVIIHR